MKLLDSEWFYRMVESQGKSPQDKLLAIFTVVDQWIGAPGIREMISGEHTPLSTIKLKTYLTNTAVAAKANHPSILAAQLIILLQGAIAEALRDPGTNAMGNAAKAAQSVVAKACQPDKRSLAVRWAATGSAATVLIAALVWHATFFANNPLHQNAVTHIADNVHAAASLPAGVNPREMETVLNLQEQFDRGVCPAPHLLALPPGQVTAYMNVVHFRTPENPEADRANLHAFLSWYAQARAQECYYAPANGHTMVKWRS